MELNDRSPETGVTSGPEKYEPHAEEKFVA
jgi:hypothetical protein